MYAKKSPDPDIVQYAVIGLNQQMFPVFLGLLIVTTIAWFFLSTRFYSILEQAYPRIYEILGRPKLFMKKSFATNFKVLRFLLKRDYETTEDQAVIRLCQGLRALFFIYLICLAGCIILLADKLF